MEHDIDVDLLCYICVAKLGLSANEFWRSTLSMIVYFIDRWADEQRAIADGYDSRAPKGTQRVAPVQQEPQRITSLREIGIGGLF